MDTTARELIIFAFAKEVQKQFPDLNVCSGCYYRDLSQSHHVGCNTLALKSTISSATFNVQHTDVLLNLFRLNRALGADIPSDNEISYVMNMCNSEWKMHVVNALVYDFDCFPDSWRFLI